MAVPVDLSWADEDELWAREGLFLVDETYKLMYDCLRPETDGSTKVTVPTVLLSKLPRQVSSKAVKRSPPGPDHVKNTHPLGYHMGDLPREGCKATSPCPISPHCIGVSHLLPVPFTPPRSSPRVL
jgi:hypothetical protein